MKESAPTVKLGRLKDSVENLKKVVNLSLPARKSFYLSKLIDIINREIPLFEQTHTQLIHKYGEPAGDGTISVETTSPNFPDFIRELDELHNVDVELVGYVRVEIPLDLIEDLNLRPLDFHILNEYIDFTE